jgi:hypothetical protein
MPYATEQDCSYRLYTLSEMGAITGAQNRVFASDHEALGHAQRLLRTHFGVELWQTHRMVGRLEQAVLAQG